MKKTITYYILFGGWIMLLLGLMADDLLLAFILWLLGLFTVIIFGLKDIIVKDKQDLKYMNDIKLAINETRRTLQEF